MAAESCALQLKSNKLTQAEREQLEATQAKHEATVLAKTAQVSAKRSAFTPAPAICFTTKSPPLLENLPSEKLNTAGILTQVVELQEFTGALALQL